MSNLMSRIPGKKMLATRSVVRDRGTLMENPATQKYSVVFAAVITFILLLTMLLAFVSGGGYVDLLLTSVIVIVLITVLLKVMTMAAESEHE